MRKTILSVLALSLLVAGTAELRADAPKADPMTSLFTALNTILLGPTQGGKDAPSLIMALPGFPIPNTGLDSTVPADMVILNNTLDTVPKPLSYYVGSGKTYSGIYQDILNQSAVQVATYTDAEQKDLAKYKADLDFSGDIMKAYLAKQKAYNDAVDALNANLATLKQGARPSSSYTNAVSNALLDWQVSGNQNTVKQDKQAFNRLMNRGAAVWWSDLLDKMNAQMADTTRPLVTVYPVPEKWGGDNMTWTKFHWSASSAVKASSANSWDVQGAVSYSKGSMGLNASGGWKRDMAKAMAEDTSTVLDVELARVVVYRPWMDSNVFDSSAWDYQGSLLTKDTPLFSDGTSMATNKGLMPIMIDQIWLARNLKITADWVGKYADQMKEAINAHLDASFGPFSMSADVNHMNQSASSSTQIQSNGITADGIQAIGFICSTVPKCPQFVASPKGKPAKKIDGN